MKASVNLKEILENFSRDALDSQKNAQNNIQMSTTRKVILSVTVSMIALFFSPISANSAINGYEECSSKQVGTLRGPVGKTEVCIGIPGGKGVWAGATGGDCGEYRGGELRPVRCARVYRVRAAGGDAGGAGGGASGGDSRAV